MAHLRTHYGIKPFVCSYCGKSFNEKGNLKTHIRIHTGERPFKCKKCNKGFKALGQLKDHLISHTGFKPFQCPYCQKFYRRKEILKNHVIIHAKDPFFQKNKEKFQEMLNNVKKMKNIIHDFDSSDYSIYKNNSIDSNSNCSISSNEDIKQSLNCSKSTSSTSSNISNFSLNKEKKIIINKNKKIFLHKKVIKEKHMYMTEKNEDKNKINLIEKINTQNEFTINNKLFKDDHYLELPNSLSDIIYNIDFSLKDENSNIENHLMNFEKKDFSFQKILGMDEKESVFSLNYNKNDFYLNNLNKKNINNFQNENDKDVESDNEDCCSKMTNLYYQEYDKKFITEFLN